MTREVGSALCNEKRSHDSFYRQRSRYERADGRWTFSTRLYEEALAYPWEPHFDLYSTERRLFIDRMLNTAARLGVRDEPVLEYACGRGDLACYLALSGFTNVHAFDLSEEGPATGRRLAEASGVRGATHFQSMNAMALDYPDNSFAFVVGFGVLHHVAKYPNTAQELYRVMRPGATALFLENLGNGPWRLIRQHTIGATEFGDINLTTAFLRTWARDFSHCDVRGIFAAFMVKRLCFIRRERADGTTIEACRFRGLAWRVARMALSACYVFDEAAINHTPLGNWLGGISLVTLRK